LLFGGRADRPAVEALLEADRGIKTAPPFLDLGGGDCGEASNLSQDEDPTRPSYCAASKVERSHRTNDEEFYQVLTYTDDVNLQARLAEWESFYNLSRPHGAFNGKAPYETLRERL
jgi:transposase InsO family protein